MKSRKRSQSTKKPSFPNMAPKGAGAGNERFTLTGEGYKVEMELPFGFCGTATKHYYGFLNYKAGSVPFIAVASFSRDREGFIKTSHHLLRLANLQPNGSKAGLAIMKKHFPNFYKASEREPNNREAWISALALDCASVFKNPSEMGKVVIENQGQWKAFADAIRTNRKTDKLNYLLANCYISEGWDKIRMAEVGKICGRILERKPFPASTIKDRTTNLNLQTKLKPGAQNKV